MMGFIEGSIELDQNGIWAFPDRKKFPYSDGKLTEAYLTRVLNKAEDLGAASRELEKHIIDWPTEYHLSHKRAQLLSGFTFDRKKRVLEVGCGCGAITRFLGETFDEVVSVEGSYERARIARLRTHGMENVSIVCAPFQDLEFEETFDIVFCIGVLEYAGNFIQSSDPYGSVLEYFSRILSREGVLVIAIENQFGLKYFSGAPEDHTGIPFDGLEGYHTKTPGPRTFGYRELKDRLDVYFPEKEFYFPFPDYKLPSCIVAEKMISKVKTGELIGQFMTRNYLTRKKMLFDEKSVLLEMEKNGMLHFFANSFLVLAGKAEISSVTPDWRGVVFGENRSKLFSGVTKFFENGEGRISVVKSTSRGEESIKAGKVIQHSGVSEWIDGRSLQFQVEDMARNRDISFEALLAPARPWFERLVSLGFDKEGRKHVNGEHMDIIWRNCFIKDGQCSFIDKEWAWDGDIPLKVIFIRSLFYFLRDIRFITAPAACLRGKSLKGLISKAARYYEIRLTGKDFSEFISIEMDLQSTILGMNPLVIRGVLRSLLGGRVGLSLLEKGIRFRNVMISDLRRAAKRMLIFCKRLTA